jgi:hypothetical protein
LLLLAVAAAIAALAGLINGAIVASGLAACQIGRHQMGNGEVLDFEGDPSAREKFVSAMHEAASSADSVAEAKVVLEDRLIACQLYGWTVEISVVPSASPATTAIEGIIVAFGRKAVTIYGAE